MEAALRLRAASGFDLKDVKVRNAATGQLDGRERQTDDNCLLIAAGEMKARKTGTGWELGLVESCTH